MRLHGLGLLSPHHDMRRLFTDQKGPTPAQEARQLAADQRALEKQERKRARSLRAAELAAARRGLFAWQGRAAI